MITTKIPLVYRSLPGMTTICLNDGLATTAHRSQVTQACVLFHLSTTNCLTFRGSPSSDLPTDHIPNVREGVKVSRMGWLQQNIDSVSLQSAIVVRAE